MKHYRSIKDAADYFKTEDPNTAVTEYFLRTSVIDGVIPSAKTGRKYIVALEDIEAFLEGKEVKP
jgi:hypothetical protein